MIRPCNCVHEAQDKLNGRGKRVYNVSAKGTVARCTVCKNEIQLSASEVKNSRSKEDKK